MLDGRVAQLGERRPYKPEVVGSSPVPPTMISFAGPWCSLVNTLACQARDRGFNSRQPRHFFVFLQRYSFLSDNDKI